MSWQSKVSFLVFAIGLTFCAKPNERGDYKSEIRQAGDNIPNAYLMEIAEVGQLLNTSGYKVIDFRKLESYEQGHLPGAIQIWRSDIEDKERPYGGIMASRNQLEELFSAKGILPSDTLIIYDENGLCDAARLWWVLQNQNFNSVKMLHGGFQGWEADASVVSQEPTQYPVSAFRFAYERQADLYASLEDVRDVIGSETLILDCRSLDEYSGKRQKKGASKGGRIPGSIHVDWASAINYQGDLRFKSTKELAAAYAELPADKMHPIIVYCHSGVRSAHTTFVLTQLLGYENVRNYDGSWTEWSFYEELNFKQDSLTTIID